MVKKGLMGLFMIALLAVSCAPAPTPTAMMENASPTAAMMEKATAMPGDAMMSETTTPEAMMSGPTATGDAMMGQSTPTGEMMSGSTPEGSMMEANWTGVDLREVATGKAFKFSDYKGKVVYIELMAAWCTTCLQQQKNLQSILSSLPSDLVVVSLDIDPNENESDLSNYVQRNGFPWSFAVAPKDVAREVGQLYGDAYLNPPSGPVLVIDRNGMAHPLPLGLKSADDLKKDLTTYLGS